MYRIVKEKRYCRLVVLFAGTKKECKANLSTIRETYPEAVIEKVDNTLQYACIWN